MILADSLIAPYLDATWPPSVFFDLLRYLIIILSGGILTVVVREMRSGVGNLRDRLILISWMFGTIVFAIEGISTMGEPVPRWQLPLMFLSAFFGVAAIFFARPGRKLIMTKANGDD